MRHSKTLFSLALAIPITYGSFASAQAATVKEVFEKYNLLGTWAWDCSKPASKNNLYYVNRLIDDNHLQRDEMVGASERRHVTVIDRAAPIGPNEITVSGKRDNQVADAIWRVEGPKQVATEVSFDGKKVIAGGKLVSNGQAVPWTNKCTAPGRQGQNAPAQMQQAELVAPPPFNSSPKERVGCKGTNEDWSRGKQVTSQITMSANSRCTRSLKPNAGITIESIEIRSQAQRGTAVANGMQGYSYVPASNFRGADSFVVAVTASGVSRPTGTALIKLNVTVQ